VLPADSASSCRAHADAWIVISPEAVPTFGHVRMGQCSMIHANHQPEVNRELAFHTSALWDDRTGFLVRTVIRILASAACYYLATRIAWELCFPDSKVSLFFPPHAVLVSALLLVPTRHWWAYTLAAAGSHFIATQAGALAAFICITLRSFRCCAKCVDSRRDSYPHQVTVSSHHTS
jgi:hypothetical protein